MAKARTVRTFPRASSAMPVALDTYGQNRIKTLVIYLQKPEFWLLDEALNWPDV